MPGAASVLGLPMIAQMGTPMPRLHCLRYDWSAFSVVVLILAVAWPCELFLWTGEDASKLTGWQLQQGHPYLNADQAARILGCSYFLEVSSFQLPCALRLLRHDNSFRHEKQ